MNGLPASVRLAWWGTAWLRGRVSPDDLRDAVVGEDAVHFVDSDPFLVGLGGMRSRGADAVGAALPAEGDPAGLGGPAVFNTEALEAGQAVLVLDAAGFPITGLVPARIGSAVTWRSIAASRRPTPDPIEAHHALSAEMQASIDTLAALDVTRWRPEVADLLMNLRHRPPVEAPDGTPARCLALAARGQQALEIVGLALEDDGGAITAGEIDARRRALTPLARAARHALVAAASPEGWPPE